MQATSGSRLVQEEGWREHDAMSASTESDAVTWPVGAVAARLSTTTATLRAWERRYGLAPSARTRGGHRRYNAQDIELLRRMLDLVVQGAAPADAARALRAGTAPRQSADADTDTSAPATAWTQADAASERHLHALIDAMHALDADTVAVLVAEALAEAGAADTWTGLLAPALTAIGEHWERTGCGVEVEHLTSGVIEAGLRHHARAARPGLLRQPPVLLAAAAGEGHTLPLTALAAALADCGTPSLLLGDLPSPALADAMRRLRPRATVLWARLPEVADPACLRHAQVVTDAALHPAGPGWDVRTLPAGTAAPLRSLPQAVDLLRSR